jgi:hypothetical protein
MKTYVHLRWYLVAFFLELEMFQRKKLQKKSKHNFTFSNYIFFGKLLRF